MSSSDIELLKILSDKEQVLFELLIKGMNTSEISKYLSMSYQETAEINRSIKQKLNASSMEDLKKIAT